MPWRRAGQHVRLDAAHEHRVRRLLGREPLQATLPRHPLRLDDLRGRERRGADVADLAGADQVGERAERLLDVGVVGGAVDLVEVDPVGLQAPQRVLDLADDPAAGVAALVGVVAHRAVDLRGEDDVVAPPAGERLADDLLGLAARVDVGGVDEVDPGVERRWMIRIESSWSGLPQAPNIIAPRHSGLTFTPVRPRVRRSMRETYRRRATARRRRSCTGPGASSAIDRLASVTGHATGDADGEVVAPKNRAAGSRRLRRAGRDEGHRSAPRTRPAPACT